MPTLAKKNNSKKLNYHSWRIDLRDLVIPRDHEEQMHLLIRCALIAPSAHNSQPWNVRITDNGLELTINSERALLADIKNRQTMISMGCALENILIAAVAMKLKPIAHITGAPSDTNTYKIHVSFSNDLTTDLEKVDIDLISYLNKRRVNRSAYLDKHVDYSIFNAVIERFDDLSFIFITDRHFKDRIADIVVDGMINSLNNDEFRAELADHLLPNDTEKKVGMVGASYGLPNFMSKIFPIMMRLFNVEKLNRSKDIMLLKKMTPVFVMITTSKDSVVSRTRVGQAYEHFALLAVKNNMATAPLAVIVESPKYRDELIEFMQIDGVPMLFFRLGFPSKSTALTPRLNLQDVLLQ